MEKIIEKVLLSETEIIDSCTTLGKRITKDYMGKELLVIGLLKGCNPFLTDLTKKILIPLEINYMIVSSYHGTTTSSNLQIKYDLETEIFGKDILLVDDIVDSGETLKAVIELLTLRKPNSINVATLLNKHNNNDLNPKYVGFKIENDFVVGYGLDFKEKYRNVPYIGILKKELYDKKENNND